MAYAFDINMLRMMKRRSKFQKYFHQVDGTVLTDGTLAILKDFKRYFETFTDHKEIDFQLFIPRMHAWNSAVSDEVMSTRVLAVKACVKGTITEEVENALQTEIANAVLSTQLVSLADKHAEGELDNLGYEVGAAYDGFRKNAGVVAEDYITTPLAELLDEDDDEGGYTWRLKCLRESMRGLRGGDFGIIAGRPDKGKTSFIASEVTHLAKQIPEHRNVLWLNNEGPGRRIIPRLYQAALNLERSELVAANQAGTADEQYEKAVGRVDKVRIADIHGMYVSRVESLIEAHNPEIVVFDMIDKIKGFGDAARTDLMLEQMYDWGREAAVKHDFVGLATSQISNEGDGEMFPTLGMLKDSKTGKQGACDFQLMIGSSNDPMLQNFRYIGLPKNKLRREGGRSDPRATVRFNHGTARYEDIGEE